MSNVNSKNKGGRPKGAKTLVRVIEYFTPEEIKEFFNNLKERGKTDNKIAIYLAEQLTGKAAQAMSIELGGEVKIIFDRSFQEN